MLYFPTNLLAFPSILLDWPRYEVGCSCLPALIWKHFGHLAGDVPNPPLESGLWPTVLPSPTQPTFPTKALPRSDLTRSAPYGLMSSLGPECTAAALPSAPAAGTKHPASLFSIAALLTPHQFSPCLFHLFSLSGALTEISRWWKSAVISRVCLGNSERQKWSKYFQSSGSSQSNTPGKEKDILIRIIIIVFFFILSTEIPG